MVRVDTLGTFLFLYALALACIGLATGNLNALLVCDVLGLAVVGAALLIVPRIAAWWRARASQAKSDSARALATARLNFCVAMISLAAVVVPFVAAAFTGNDHPRESARQACAREIRLEPVTGDVRHRPGVRKGH